MVQTTLDGYSKMELSKIVDIYNLGIDEKILKKKKADLIKEMMKVGKKKFVSNEEIDKKLASKTEKKKGKKAKEDPKQPKITAKFHKMPDGSIHTGEKHTKESKKVSATNKEVKAFFKSEAKKKK